MINQNFDILAAILALIGALNYAWVTFRGKAQPNRVSWLLWTITPSISFAVELAQHVHLQVTLLTLSEAIGPFFVVVGSFANKQAYWKASTFDWICGGISVLAVVLWLVTGQGDLALIFSLVASLSSAIPTIIKSYTHPRSESPWDYLASLVAGIITLLTIQHWTLGNYGFPVYITLESLVIAALVLTPQRVREKAAVTAPLNAVTPVAAGNAERSGPGQGMTQDVVQAAQVLVSARPAINQTMPANSSHVRPVLGSLIWSQNPVLKGGTTLLEAHLAFGTLPIVQAEYIGSVDPGPGRGFPMAIQGDMVVATFVASVPRGTYPIAVRAKDAQGVWTDLCYTKLEIVEAT